MRNLITWGGCMVLALGAASAGCGGADVDAVSEDRASTRVVATPGRHPNASRYSDTGARPATGRSGTASLTVRALVNRDRSADVEMTTGSFEGAAPAPGSIARAQLKVYGDDGALLGTTNHNDASPGYRVVTVGGLHAGQRLQVQANVRGVDGRRTDVVTTSVTARLRPDLAAGDLAAPAQTYVNTLVDITATVRELNHEVGARASCVLSVDGEPVDQALGIWVDAGGAVTCAFTHTFHAVGAHALSVAVTDVAPGDWDASNNRVAGSIEVVEPSRSLNYEAIAEDVEETSSSRSSGTYRSPGYNRDYDHHNVNSRWNQRVELRGWTSRPLAFPLAVRASESADGVEQVAVEHPRLDADWSTSYETPGGSVSQACASRYDDERNTQLHVCVYDQTWYGSRYAQSNVTYSRHAGQVTYQSAGYTREWYGSDPSAGYTYTFNYSGESRDGTRVAMGAIHGFDVSLGDADHTFRARPSLAMTASRYDYAQPPYCYEASYYAGVLQRDCYESSYGYALLSGYASDYSNP